MKSKEFIKNKLEQLSKEFQEISIRYQFDKRDLTHIIEIKPLKEFNDNSSYQEKEAEITYEFEQLFFPETILFISENSLTKITEPELEYNMNLAAYISIQFKELLEKMSFAVMIDIKEPAGNDYNYAMAA
jgi:hypothetical protein